MNKKQIILEFLKKNTLAVLSTIKPDNTPESAVLEFGQSDDLEIIFDCFNYSRKYKNLQTNKNVSLVIGWDENITVQYEGVAEELLGDDLKKYQNLYFAKNPDARRWLNQEGISYFKVTPKWIRYSDLRTHPWTVFEYTPDIEIL